MTEAPVMNTYRYRKRIEKWLFKYSHLKLANRINASESVFTQLHLFILSFLSYHVKISATRHLINNFIYIHILFQKRVALLNSIIW
ncbi:hypothetical protein AZ66_27310 [Paenibacillus sp. E194]|uniref:Uncharacterized protein n=1 Tax=Paenibacillus alvei TS-15 TaxID=1117108 RepID=S9U8Q0_PAEAL|nr:hypothetical protein PAALTS15_12662 [Paenibacillus alvei TS-15]KJB85008.1 hypothetical protein AZ66_27310 [Paenibacillus sp. E194]